MFDIHFFRNCMELKKKIVDGAVNLTAEEIYAEIEKLRSKRPHVFNIETTNNCNMTCKMCPRTTLMTRPIKTMPMELFTKIVKQLVPHRQEDLNSFWDFVVKEYGIKPEHRDENSFYFYRISNHVILHGYGEPLVDPMIVDRVQTCTDHGIPTYFSCVADNINVEKFKQLFKAGAGVIKFSMDALDDDKAQSIRGKRASFARAYEKINEVLKIKQSDSSIKTNITLTMIAMSNSEEDRKMHNDFMELWKDQPVFSYIKSQDNRWYMEEDETLECKNHYEKQYCEYPFTSMTVMADGSVVPCTQDYDCEMKFGNANEQSLEEIWNSKGYADFRMGHITGKFTTNVKCVDRCDQKLICDRLRQKAGVL